MPWQGWLGALLVVALCTAVSELLLPYTERAAMNAGPPYCEGRSFVSGTRYIATMPKLDVIAVASAAFACWNTLRNRG